MLLYHNVGMFVHPCIVHNSYAFFKTLLESSLPDTMTSSEGKRSATIALLLPGKILDLKVLNQKRAFCNSGNKSGAVKGFEVLEESGLGRIITTKINRGATMVTAFGETCLICKIIEDDYASYLCIKSLFN